jgi:hypothetical protein
VVQTAGGGGTAHAGAHGGQSSPTHCGLIEGVADAQRLRTQILARLQQSRTAGLGDDETPVQTPQRSGWSEAQRLALQEICDAARALAERPLTSSRQ